MSNQWMPPPGGQPPQGPRYYPPPVPHHPQQPLLPPPQSSAGAGFVAQILGLGCLGIAMFAIAALLLLLFAAELGLPTLLLAVVMAFVPAAAYISIVLLIDRYDPEPPWVLMLSFVWGAVIAVFGSLIVNDTTTMIAAQAGGAAVGDFVGAVISAPLAEEAFKGLGVLIVLLMLRKEFDGVVDGIVYACVVALGFATVENVLYYGRAVLTDGAGTGAAVFVLRGMLSPFAHPLFTSMTGIGLGIAREQKRGALVWLAPPAGYALAVLLHALWNFVATISAAGGGGGFFFLAYLVGWIPAFVCFMIAVGFCLYRERKVIREHLYDEVAIGALTPAEYMSVTSLWRRTGFHWRAFSGGGVRHYRAAKGLSRAATKLALSKWHTLRASQKNAETRSLGQIPVMRQEIARHRAELARR
jgi:RsiW-degrading membrane proteinase PrsW (M82 family)